MRLPLLIAATVLVWCSPALAHRLHVEAKLTDDHVRVEAYYDDATPAQEAKITVRLGDQLVAEGRTDDRGVWTCPLPKPGTYTIRAQSAGHAATETLLVPEAEQAAVESPPEDDRSSRTRTRWARLAAGLAIIGGLWLGWRVTRRATAQTDGPA